MANSLVCGRTFASALGETEVIAEHSLFSLKLKSLQQPAWVELAPMRDKKIILSYFSADCVWCFRQIIALEQLRQHCGEGTQIILVGVHGSRQELQSDLRRTKTQLPAFEASLNLLKLTGQIPTTPQTFIFDRQGVVVDKIRGYSASNTAFTNVCSAQSAL